MEVFRNPDARYTGTLWIVVPGEPHAGRSDWTEPNDRFRVQTHFSHRKDAEVFTVGLDHRQGP